MILPYEPLFPNEPNHQGKSGYSEIYILNFEFAIVLGNSRRNVVIFYYFPAPGNYFFKINSCAPDLENFNNRGPVQGVDKRNTEALVGEKGEGQQLSLGLQMGDLQNVENSRPGEKEGQNKSKKEETSKALYSPSPLKDLRNGQLLYSSTKDRHEREAGAGLKLAPKIT